MSRARWSAVVAGTTVLLLLLLCGTARAGVVDAAQPTEPRDPDEPRDPNDPDPSDPDPNDPTEPLPPPPTGEPPSLPEPDPPREPEPDPEPEPVPTGDPGGGSGSGQPQGEPPAIPETPEEPDKPKTWGAAPFGDLTTGTSATNIELGGDILLPQKCREKNNACNGGRIGARARFPVVEGSATGAGRAGADALQGFSKSWRVGLVVDWIRDTTGMEGPAKFFMMTAAGEWGVQSFSYNPEAGDDSRLETKHSADFLLRALLYRYQPRRYRVAPQIIARYRRDWDGAKPVGIVQSAGEGLPDITRDLTIEGPNAAPVFAVTVPVLFSIQRGERVLPQLGFGPAVSYAARGKNRGYNPFNEEILVRLEHWVYWYPTGTEGLEGPKANVRIGAAPFLDIRMRGPGGSERTTNVGALIEVKVGVRGYEY